ncbi:DUF3304 domain-containing protein [Paraburkholderia sp. C35]|uniref:DUF3304 domain-containing protein n=1 Tax=Paraburkholderia sp. C35 TaxID=2126993 RepID=UPI0013A5798B|nr:DUF3304 domain-containing protein [Paraburkholderia sp. C35]
MGYDYTDRALLGFSVNGMSGGNVLLSTSTAGGGKYACCVRLDPTIQTPFDIDVGYIREALVEYPSERIIKPADQDIVRAHVRVTGPVAEKPAYPEVHFFPDGHIEASLSGKDGPSPTRLRLSRRLPYIR